MNKVNSFCEKYETSIWQVIASLWFFSEYFFNKGSESLVGAGVFWLVFAIFEAIRINMKTKSNKKK